jgi:hypothetical protein
VTPRNTPLTTPHGWLVITSYTQKVVAEYPTREEAEAAAEWHQKTYGGPTLEVCRAS